VRTFQRIRTWTSIGLLLMAAGLPYCAAALSWGVTSDDDSISLRADIAFGVLLALIGAALLAVVMLVWGIRRLRRARRESSSGQTPARSRG
jgi:hypothetical protein